MLDDQQLAAATLTDILAFARTLPSIDALLGFVLARSPALLRCQGIEVVPGPPRPVEDDPPVRGDVHVARHLVRCGRSDWGELRLTYDGDPGPGEAERGRLLAEVLGAALVTARADLGAAALAPRDPGSASAAGRSRPDRRLLDAERLVAVVMECSDELDLLASATTRARLSLVAGRLAEAVGAASWAVGAVHQGRLYEVAAGRPGAERPTADTGGISGWIDLATFPSRAEASEGGAFHADLVSGDEAERLALAQGGRVEVMGAGGYDLDGRAWVVEVLAESGARLRYATPTLLALVLAALSFPREAAVPRPLEPWLRRLLSGSPTTLADVEARGMGEAG